VSAIHQSVRLRVRGSLKNVIRDIESKDIESKNVLVGFSLALYLAIHDTAPK
jgi:hypothetical protein